MWDVLSGDFDSKISPEQCLQNVLDNIQPGSIVLFHDSLKAEARMRFALPKVLEKLKEEGWRFEKLPNPD
jgi:peptidoglycan/xylan/chitin deacetylase (PgdA/CDA1 family)